MHGKRRLNRIVLTAAALSTATGLAACSAAPAQDAKDAKDVQAAIPQSVLDELNQKLDGYSQDPAFEAPGPAFDAKSAMSGKYIYSIPYSMAIEFNSSIVKSMSQAADAVGFKFSSWASNGEPTSWVQGMNTAISAKPDLIDTVTNQPATFLPQVKDAIANGIKLVDSHSFGVEQETPESLNKLGVEYANGPYELGGQLMADWVIAKSKGNAKVLVLTAYDSSSSPALQAGIKEDFAKFCPETCEYKIESIPVNAWATASSRQFSPRSQRILISIGSS